MLTLVTNLSNLPNLEEQAMTNMQPIMMIRELRRFTLADRLS
jgi:hypothetical protein